MLNGYQSIDITGGYGISRNLYINPQNLINMYVALNQSSGKQFLAPMFGYDLASTLPEGSVIRALYVPPNDELSMYVVSSEHVYKLSIGLIPTTIGVLNTTLGYVGISSNTAGEITFVDGLDTWVWDGSTFSLPDNVSPYGRPSQPEDIDFLDGFTVIATSFEGQFFISDLNESKKINLQNFGEFQALADPLLAVRQFRNATLYLFGSRHIEAWNPDPSLGATGFPFSRNNNLVFRHGVSSAASIATAFDHLFYLSQDDNGPSSVMCIFPQQFVPIQISTPEINWAIQNFNTPNDAQGFAFREGGDIFYQISFTGGNKTFLYNLTTKKWSELQTNFLNRHPASCHAYFNGVHYLGDYQSANLYNMSSSIYSYNKYSARKTLITPPLRRGSKNACQLPFLQLILPPALGESSGKNIQPVIYLSVSRNGGRTYNNAHPTNTGKLGVYDARIIWRDLGVSRDFVLKIEYDNSTEFYIDSLWAQILEEQKV